MCVIEHCHLTKAPNIFKVPKKIPEEKVPAPVQRKEAPPAKGTLSLSNPNFFSHSSLSCLYFMLMCLIFDVQCPSLLLVVLNIKTLSLKCQKYQRKFQKRKFQERKFQKRKSPKRKSLCPKRKLFPLLKVFLEKALLFLSFHGSLLLVIFSYTLNRCVSSYL